MKIIFSYIFGNNLKLLKKLIVLFTISSIFFFSLINCQTDNSFGSYDNAKESIITNASPSSFEINLTEKNLRNKVSEKVSLYEIFGLISLPFPFLKSEYQIASPLLTLQTLFISPENNHSLRSPPAVLI